jgi:hypothetical protein
MDFSNVGIFMEIEVMAKNHRLFQNEIERKRGQCQFGSKPSRN